MRFKYRSVATIHVRATQVDDGASAVVLEYPGDNFWVRSWIMSEWREGRGRTAFVSDSVPRLLYRFDYLARDSTHVGIHLGCNFNRIFRFSKVDPVPELLKFSRHR